jgi:hypothetical protein
VRLETIEETTFLIGQKSGLLKNGIQKKNRTIKKKVGYVGDLLLLLGGSSKRRDFVVAV